MQGESVGESAKARNVTRRARTDEAREDRRAAILAAAAAALAEEGFEAVSMNGLAERAGLAKGTLYLYFRTREEVFLALFLERLAGFAGRVESGCRPGQGDEEAVASLVAAAEADPILLALMARLGAVIEQNLPAEVLFAAKRETMARFRAFSARLAAACGLGEEAESAFGLSAMVALQGAAGASAVAPPGGVELPADIAEIFAMSQFRPLATVALATALAGARAIDARSPARERGRTSGA
ncbi:MAG: TetR/AcrR family transcriptional regulator [Paracoccaceae bacterium]|nr:TetR/AcrR family transcriptional regulator [Paracoccaceae bacterium]